MVYWQNTHSYIGICKPMPLSYTLGIRDEVTVFEDNSFWLTGRT